MADKATVVIAAAGTGGHIFPAMAVANRLSQQGYAIQWLGSPNRLEQKVVPQHYPLHTISISALRGKGWRRRLLMPLQLLRATWQARRFIKRVQPKMLLVMGGFVAVPAGLAAKFAGVPLLLHEQNAIAGMSNRYLSRWSNVVMQAFPNTFADSLHPQTVGNPLRAELLNLPTPEQREATHAGQPLRVLLLGGSQGARFINISMRDSLLRIAKQTSLEVYHQTGVSDEATVQAAYQQAGVAAKVSAFIDDMAAAYAWADVVVSRSGALSVAEIAAAGLPSLLVPYPYAVDNHQWHNAHYLETVGAALIIEQKDFSADSVYHALQSVLCDAAQLHTMAQAARAAAQLQATDNVVTLCLEVLA